ncbi:MAG: 50S ribosomal protein L14 [Candidatus Nezhaarchaeales archaeon]
MAKRGPKVAAGISYRPRISPAVFPGSRIKCVDNSGAHEVAMIGMIGGKSRHRRIVGAGVGDMILVSVKKGTPELRKQIMRAIVVRQKKPFRRLSGQWVQFEDNAVVIVTEDGSPKGTEVRGPIAREAAERWPRIAALATLIV